MEQFRQVGEVLGSMKALMVLEDEILINQRQCSLMIDICSVAFKMISASIKQNLKLGEKNTTKWKALEQPLKELQRVFLEAESYITRCMDSRQWWAKVVTLHQNMDSVEFHVHNLLSTFPAVIEAIEIAGEIAGLDPDEMQKKGILLRRKYDQELNDPKVFSLKFGERYLVTMELRKRFESAWREDRWLLGEAIKGRKKVESNNKKQLGEYMLKKVIESAYESSEITLFPSSVLTESKNYQVRRRMGSKGQFKEIQWLGESFVLRQVVAEIETVKPEIQTMLSLSHPNIIQYLCGFCDQERNEFLLVMELMSKDLYTHIREISNPKRRSPPPVPVIIDIMLQIARGMEYLHSKGIFHGDLNPKNVHLKSRTSSEGFFHVKVSGFGLSSVDDNVSSSSQKSRETANSLDPCIWYAPEVLAEQVRHRSTSQSLSKIKYSEKADVYSFGMICFELLTGKVPFEDGHLQGDKITRNITAGERPLFPFSAPKYLVNLTKKCWADDTASRPSFSSICRILRYTKKFLMMNPEFDQQQPELRIPSVEFCDIENRFHKRFLETEDTGSPGVMPVWEVPFQMFSYRIAEIERTQRTVPNVNKSKSDDGSTHKEENLSVVDNQQPPVEIDVSSTCSDSVGKRSTAVKRATSLAPKKNLTGNRRLSDVKSVCSLEDRPTDVRSVCSENPERRAVPLRKHITVSSRRTHPAPTKKPENRPSRLNPTPRTPGLRKTNSNGSLLLIPADNNGTEIRDHASDSELI